VFIDENLRPFDDQWAFLSSLSRISAAHVSEIVEEAETKGALLGVRVPVDDELADKPWNLPPSRRRAPPVIESALPTTIEATLADQLYVAREGLPPAFVARMVRLAHVELALQDLRNSGRTLPASVRFCGELREGQIEALEALAAHDLGVLAATTAFGKTVVAAALIASRARNTLVLVHRGELLAQWVDRLATFLAIDRTAIGVIGGGKRRLTGVIDIAVIQSLVRRGEADDLVADYGHLIVDECHHVSAASFELAVRRAKAKYVLGLSATVARKDGHHPIIFMQCGPVRYRANARSLPRARASRNGRRSK
jgi:Type III restriction enzyme, res subunit